MGDETSRDLVWNSVLELLNTPSPGGFRLETIRRHAGLSKSQEQTIRRVLNAMESLGYLQRESHQGHYWYAGPRANQYLRTDYKGEPFILNLVNEDGNSVAGRGSNYVYIRAGHRSGDNVDPLTWVTLDKTAENAKYNHEFRLEERNKVREYFDEGGIVEAISRNDNDITYRVRPIIYWASEDNRYYIEDINIFEILKDDDNT